MATLALTYVGAAIGTAISPGVGTFSGAAIGGAIGGFIGGYIDSQYLFPALFPPPELKGPKLDDLGAQVASEGSPQKYILGPQNRVAGVVQWMRPLKEVKDTRRVGKGGGGQKVSQYTYFANLAIAICRAPQPDGIWQIRRIWADAKLVYENGEQVGARYKELVIYTGSEASNASPSPLIESYEGEGNVPRYRRRAYITFEDFEVTDFGNRIPNFTFEVAAHAELSLANGLKELLLLGGLEESQFDVSRVPGCLRGYVINGPLDTLSAIQPLMLAYNLTCQEVNGKLVFFEKGSEEYVTVPSSDLAAHTPGSRVPRLLSIADANGIDLPSRVDVKFIDPDLDLLGGGVAERRVSVPNQAQTTLDYPITLRSDEARTIGKRTLWTAWAERQGGELYLPPSYAGVNEGCIIDTTVDGERYFIRASELQRGANQLLRIKGNIIDPATYVQFAITDNPNRTTPPTYTPPDTTFFILDLPALLDAHTEAVGFYYAICATDPEDGWRGAGLFSSADDSTFSLLTDVVAEASIGTALTQLQVGAPEYWDLDSTVTIELLDGELESVTEDECLSGLNRALIGSEIIGFQVATLTDERTYTLSKLLRGLRGTELTARDIHGHSVGEAVLILEAGPTGWWELGASGMGGTRYYKAASQGSLLSDVDSAQFTCTANTLRPFPPCNIQSYRTSGDIHISWTRRTRAITNIFAPIGAPLRSGETPEVYEIDIMTAGYFGIVKRTIIVTGTTSVTYSAADQATDFGSPQSAVQINIYMRSSLVGRSRPEPAVI